jgi:hypothetical protein
MAKLRYYGWGVRAFLPDQNGEVAHIIMLVHPQKLFLNLCPLRPPSLNPTGPPPVTIGLRDGGGAGGATAPPKKITKSKSRANVQHKSGEEWEIKKPKSAQFVGQTKAVGQYSLHSRAINIGLLQKELGQIMSILWLI